MQNRITIFLDHGHGFMGLDYQPKGDKKPIHFYAGLYPSSICKQDTCRISNNEESFYSSYVNELMFFTASSILPDPMLSRIFPPIVSIVQGIPSTFLSISSNNKQNYCIAHEGPSSSQSGIDFVADTNYSPTYIQDIPQISYNISVEGAERVYNRIKYLTENCDINYEFNSLTHSCLFFAKEMYAEAGLEKKLFSEIYKMPVGFSLIGFYMKAYDAYLYHSIDVNYLFGLMTFIAMNRLIKHTTHRFFFFSNSAICSQNLEEQTKEHIKQVHEKPNRNCCIIL
ncbi:MAG: hypothetical protein JO131_03375 [Gammaproteobacteria bacterium]|nr:hypothetical protein [Gammaproteobacteria bacterium]